MGSMEEGDTAYLSQRIAHMESRLQLQADLYLIERRSGKRWFAVCGIIQMLWLLACTSVIAVIFLDRIPKIQLSYKLNYKELEEKIEEVRNPPFGYFCAYKSSFSTANSVITYDRLLYSSQFGLQGESPGIDITSGKFVAGFSGTWRLDFSLYTLPDPGDDISLYLYRNGEQIPETRFRSTRSSKVSGYDVNTGGRSVLLRLDLGDELYIRTTVMEDSVNNIIFCASLEQFDV